MTEKKPEAVAGAFILNAEDKLMLISGPKYEGRYVVPGGRVEYGESLEEAVHREVLEETGLEIEVIKLLGHAEAICQEGFAPDRHFIFFNFLCRAKHTNFTPSNEAERHKWVSREDLSQIDIGMFTRQVIDKHSIL